jgi:hypothetical protein
MRARYPDSDGFVVRDGAEIRYERYGEGRPAILLLPTWSLVHSARITEVAGKPVSYRDVETDGAARAAQLIGELI